MRCKKVALMLGERAQKHPHRMERIFRDLQDGVQSHLPDGTRLDFKGLTIASVTGKTRPRHLMSTKSPLRQAAPCPDCGSLGGILYSQEDM